jgi:hypothetical protein
MPRPHFTLRVLLVAMLVVAAFLGGVRFERERRRRADQASQCEAFEADRNAMLNDMRQLQLTLAESNARSLKAMQQPVYRPASRGR